MSSREIEARADAGTEWPMLMLGNEDVERVITMPMVIDALERAYRDLGAGEATDVPRADSLVVHPERPDAAHAFKTMSASYPRKQIAALRLNSDVIEWPVAEDGTVRRRKLRSAPGDRYNGLIQLFSTATGEPLAMLPDGVVQRMRVGGTNGLAIRHLATPDARVVGLLGSGGQAGAQIQAVTHVRDIEVIRVFSPNVERRKEFVAAVGREVDCEVIAVESPDAAVEDADIIMLATNSLGAVFEERWTRPGLLATSIRGPEISGGALAGFDRVVVHSRDIVRGYASAAARTAVPEFQSGEYRRADAGAFDLHTAATLVEVMGDPARGRASDDESIAFHNFVGLGLQFAAVGAAVLEAARAAGLGRDLPTEWFLQDVQP